MKIFNEPLPEIELKYKSGLVSKRQIKSSRDVFETCQVLFNQDTVELREEFLIILLNRANKTIGWCRISQGGISGTVTDVRLIMMVALKAAASGLILAHNHPSGNNSPSDSDVMITNKIKEASHFFDIVLLDHLIYAGDEYYSFADNGAI